MTEPRKADVDGALDALEAELELAIEQDLIRVSFQWTATLDVREGKQWIAVLTVGRAGEKT